MSEVSAGAATGLTHPPARPLAPLQGPYAMPDRPGTLLLQLCHSLRGCKVATPQLPPLASHLPLLSKSLALY